MRLALLLALFSSSAQIARVPVLGRAALPAVPTVSLSRAPLGLPSSPILTTPKATLPSASAPSASAQLAAQGPSAVPVDPRSDEEFASNMEAVMTIQSAVLAMASRATGFDPLVLSLGMSMSAHGITVADWAKVGLGLQELDSDWGEAEAVLSHRLRSNMFSKDFRAGKKIEPDDLFQLSWSIKELPREVEIARNGAYLGWRYRWEAGEASAAGVDFSGASVRQTSGGWLITLGTLPSGEKLRVTLAELGGKPDARPQLEALLKSPLLTPAQRADLAAFERRLAAAGLLPK